MCTTATEHLINNYLSKNRDIKNVQVVTRSTQSIKPPISYSKQLETTYNEDDRASDLTYNPDSEYTDTDDTSDDDTSGQAYAPLNKCLPSSPLTSSPQYPKSQTQLTPEPYSSTLYPEPYSSTLNPEPYSSTTTQEPYSSTLNPEPNSSTLTPELHSSTQTLEPHNSSLIPKPYSSHPKIIKPLTEPYSPDIEPKMQQVEAKPQVCTKDVIEELPELPILPQGTNTQVLKQQTKDDPTLKTIRGLAHHQKNGYGWENGLIIYIRTDHTLGEKKRLVIPKPLRQLLITLAHDKSGHFSVNKTKAVLNNKFAWPGMNKDVTDYILSCETCRQFNKQTHKPAPFHTRPVFTEPFDEIALDIIGPLPRSKHGNRFALTAICMASRWPEVYPLRDTKAESIVDGLIEFLTRNGIPSKILTDQGSQFTSEVMTQTCQRLGITHITTVPYRPQGNGILERFHGTLKPLLAKAKST